MPDFLLPDLGEGLGEAEVIAWRVQVGDRVAVDQVIAEVETAKAVVEVPVPYAGVVAALHAAPRHRRLRRAAADHRHGGRAAVREPGVVVPASPGTDGRPAGGQRQRPDRLRHDRRAAPQRRGRRRAAPSRGAPVPGRPGGGDLADRPQGGQGRRPRPDLPHRYGTGGRGEPPGRPPGHRRARHNAAAASARGPGRRRAEAGERRIPLRGARRTAADKLSRSRREIPEATVWVDVDATGLVEARRALNAGDPARPVSLLALLARFAILGLRRYPELNARIEQDEIIVPESGPPRLRRADRPRPGRPRRPRRAPPDDAGPVGPPGGSHCGGPRTPPRPGGPGTAARSR